ncbi:uncharacterized protein FA14DRAFT_173402 [Meira miltonrushii]|uniref:Uncharacterized protein n=1 Tax=Meira miltonrushii TaxID=1280837 RepID=A0A316VBJ5_9BASI|nr:uncharacterized protein FA14DRAFT_173402 [Meira miltonrushii]PWN33623.1 hypothetical protein FA14DRAFT_173402 [Meira miltonrushii]
MPKSWSLGRSSSQKLQPGKEEEQQHVKRPGFKISRPRPSSMVSVEFPSSPTISHDGEWEKNEHSRQMNGSGPNSLYEHEQHSGSALNLLSVTQQRDQALRERKDSAASSTSLESGTNGDSASSKHTNPPTPSRRHISTATLPSLMKSPSRSSALSSTSTDTTYISASPRPAGKAKKQEGSSIKSQDFANGQKSEISRSTKRTLKDVTNQSSANHPEEVKQTSRKDQQTKSKSKTAHPSTTAMDSLYQLRGNQTKNGGRSSIDKSLGSTQHASLVVTSPTLSQGENEVQPISRPDKHEYPYVVRSRKSSRTGKKSLIDTYPSRYRSRSKDASAKQSTALARYELMYNSGSYLHLSLSQKQALESSRQYQYGLLGVPIPTHFATDRLTAWAVERASRIASSFIYLFGS